MNFAGFSACCASCELKTTPPRGAFAGFEEDGKAALDASPGYFLAWYSAKSILLVVAVAALAYQLGKKA